ALSLSALPGSAAAQRGGGSEQSTPKPGAGDSSASDRGGRGVHSERTESPLEALPDANAWRVLVARDPRIAFTERTTDEARAILSLPDLTPERRAIALLALGAAGDASERAQLERIARSGAGLERRAAILALGQ